MPVKRQEEDGLQEEVKRPLPLSFGDWYHCRTREAAARWENQYHNTSRS